MTSRQESHDWIFDGKAVVCDNMELQEWCNKEELYICTAYLGMLRIYKNNKCIWSTSGMGNILNILYGPKNQFGGIDLLRNKNEMAAAGRVFLYKLKNMSDKDRKKIYEDTHIGLL